MSCPPHPHPDPGPGGREPGGFGRCPVPSSVPPSGNASVLPPPGGTGSGPDYHLQCPRLQQIWCGNLQDLERLKNPSFALSAGPKLAEISRLPTPWRGTQEGKIPLPDPLGFSCPGTSLASRGRSPAWEGEGGSQGLLFYSWVVLLRQELGRTFLVFRKSGACYPKQALRLKPPKLALCVSPHQRLVGCRGSVSFANVTVTSGVPRP